MNLSKAATSPNLTQMSGLNQEVDYLALMLGIQKVAVLDAVTISSFVYIRRKQEEDRERDEGLGERYGSEGRRNVTYANKKLEHHQV